MTENKSIRYQNGIFSVEDNLFYENNIRIGYFEDEEKEEILENNHKAVVDRLTDLRDSNIDLKRSNKKLRKENKELKQENVNIISDLDYYRAKSGSCEEGLFQKDREIAKLEKENEELKKQLKDCTKKAKEEIRKQREEDAIRWANIGR